MQLQTIHLHGFVEQMLKIQMSDTPHIISRKLELPQSQHMLFIHHGRLLSPALSFKIQGVKDNDDLYLVVKKCPEPILTHPHHTRSKYIQLAKSDLKKQIMDRYRDRYNDQDQLFEQMLFARNPKTHNEFAKLVDLYKMRLESNPNSYRKIIDNFEAFQNNLTPGKQLNQPNQTPEPTVIPPKPLFPSTDLMPILPT